MQSTERSLFILKVSPWSERAKWMLDYHALAYNVIEHAPGLGERRLRRLVGDKKKIATVPLLIAGDQIFTESWDIALYADREGKKPKLIPADREAEVRTWNDLTDETMVAARALVVSGMLTNPAAIDENHPPNVPGWLRPLLRPIARQGIKWFARKYDVRFADKQEERINRLRSSLEIVRKALDKNADYLLGNFSYADIIVASFLQGISPVDDRYIPLGPATRKVWTQEALAAEYSDLIAWRDRLYRAHR